MQRAFPAVFRRTSTLDFSFVWPRPWLFLWVKVLPANSAMENLQARRATPFAGCVMAGSIAYDIAGSDSLSITQGSCDSNYQLTYVNIWRVMLASGVTTV